MTRFLRVPIRLSEEAYLQYLDEMTGLCRGCGAEADTVEPDARGYNCAACGRMEVYGVEELLVRGEIEITGREG